MVQDFWEAKSSVDDLIGIMGDSFTQTFDGLVDGTIDAKDAFNDMINSMLRDMAKFIFSRQVQQFAQLLTDWAMTGYGSPSPASAPSAPTTFAAPRYIVHPPTMNAGVATLSAGAAAVGRASPMPSLGSVLSQGGKDAPVVNVNVSNQSSAKVDVQESTDGSGNVNIEMIITDAVRSALTTGKLDRQMQTSFGIRRKPI